MVFSDTPPLQPAGEHRREEEDATAPRSAESPEDRRLVERVEQALCTTGHGALRTSRSPSTVGSSSLGGRVSSYYLKQVAQAAVLAVAGSHQIRNSVDVVRPNSSHQGVVRRSLPVRRHEERAAAMKGSA